MCSIVVRVMLIDRDLKSLFLFLEAEFVSSRCGCLKRKTFNGKVFFRVEICTSFIKQESCYQCHKQLISLLTKFASGRIEHIKFDYCR